MHQGQPSSSSLTAGPWLALPRVQSLTESQPAGMAFAGGKCQAALQEGRQRAPPVVVLGAELEIAEDDGDLRAGDDEDDKHKAQEAKEVVELVQPHAGQDEEELNEDRAKGQDAANEHAEGWVHVPRLQQQSWLSNLLHTS